MLFSSHFVFCLLVFVIFSLIHSFQKYKQWEICGGKVIVVCEGNSIKLHSTHIHTYHILFSSSINCAYSICSYGWFAFLLVFLVMVVVVVCVVVAFFFHAFIVSCFIWFIFSLSISPSHHFFMFIYSNDMLSTEVLEQMRKLYIWPIYFLCSFIYIYNI